MTAIAFLSIALSVWMYYYFVKVKRAPWRGWRSNLTFGINAFGSTILFEMGSKLLAIQDNDLLVFVIRTIIIIAIWRGMETIPMKLFGKPTPRKQSDYSPAKQ